MKRSLKIIAILLGCYIFLNLLTPYIEQLRNRSIDNQINYIEKILNKGYDNVLQQRYPEGRIFSNALFSLAVLDYVDKTDLLEKRYASILDKRVKRLLSETTTRIFSEDMKPKYGVFYNGWIGLVLKRYRESGLFEYSVIGDDIQSAYSVIQDELIQAQGDSVHMLDTYRDAVWPGDNMAGIAAIEDKQLSSQWLQVLMNHSNHESGLINHKGSNQDEVRGSSQALILYIMTQTHKDQSELQYPLFDDLLIDHILGVDLVKEHEEGKGSKSDVDSGPLIFGYGAVATIMNIKTQAALGNYRSKNTWAFLNMLGMPINIFGGKYYLFKQEPMFDIFMLWCAVEL